jgi:hypothetical protein
MTDVQGLRRHRLSFALRLFRSAWFDVLKGTRFVLLAPVGETTATTEALRGSCIGAGPVRG